MTSKYTLSYKDRDGEGTSISVYSADLNAGNFAAQLAEAQALRDAIQAISLLTLDKESLLATETAYDDPLPTNIYAQRGIKLLVRGRDTNGNSVTFHIPGPNLALPNLMVGENVDLTSAEGAALVTAIENFVTSNDGEAVTVREIVYID